MQSLLHCETEPEAGRERGKEDHLSQCTSFWHRTPKECEISRFEPSLPSSNEESIFVKAKEYNILYFLIARSYDLYLNMWK